MNSESIKDSWIFFYVYPLIALVAVHIGNDNTFEQLAQIPSYYSDLVLAFCCTFGVGFYFRWLFKKLERNFNWNNLSERLLIHGFFGVVLPTSLIIAIELLYLKLFLEIAISDSSIFYLELPVILMCCALISFIYTILYYKKHHELTTSQLHSKFESLAKETKLNKESKSDFLVQFGSKSMNIPISQIAYFAVESRTTFLITTEGKKFLYDFPLATLLTELPTSKFYQLNRQIVACRSCIANFNLTETRRIEVSLSPNYQLPIFVSKKNSSAFLSWMNNY